MDPIDSSEWKNPSCQFRPMVRWWWPGMDVEENELLKELEELKEKGFGGAEIQAFLFGVPGSIRQKTEKIHRYAPHQYFNEILKSVLEKASKLELVIDLTIGSAWPAGGTTVSKENSLKTLMMGTKIITNKNKNQPIKIPPPQVNPYYGKQKLMKNLMGPILEEFYEQDFYPLCTVAVQPKKKSKSLNFVFPKATPLKIETAIDISDKLRENGIIEWEFPAGTWQIFTIYTGPSGNTPMLDSKGNPNKPSLVVDFFNEKRVHQYLDDTLGPLKEIVSANNPLRALFTDSQEVASEWYWTEDFFEEFQQRRGYDVRPFLPACFVPNRDNQFLEVFFQGEKPCFEFPKVGEKIRYDWLTTLSELWAERYCHGVSEWGKNWASQRPLLHRIQTYGITLDLLLAYGAADIPESEQLYAGGILDFMRLAGSAGIIYKKPIVSCESMVWRFRDRITTPLKWKAAADREFVAGINQMIYHGFPYMHPDIPYPSYDAWGSVSSVFNRTNPFWDHFNIVNDYIARGQYLLQISRPNAKIGIFYNLFNYDYKFLHQEDLVGGYLPDYDIKPAGGPIIWFMKQARKPIDKKTKYLQEIAEELINAGFYYTHFNEERFLNAEIRDGELIMGWARLEAIILPNIHHLSIPMLNKMRLCQEAGIKLICTENLPNEQSGYKNYQENDLIIENEMKNLQEQGAINLLKKADLIKELNRARIHTEVNYSVNQTSVKFIHKTYENSGNEHEIYFFRHGGSTPIELVTYFDLDGYQPFKMDLWTGKVIPIVNYKKINQKIMINQTFTPYGSTCLIFIKNPSPKIWVEKANIDNISYPANLELDFNELQQFQIDPKGIYSEITRYYSQKQYYITLNTGEEFHFQNPNDISLSIPLINWKLEVEHREKSGDIQNITVTLPILKDWRKIKELQFCHGPGHYKTRFILSNILDSEDKIMLDLGKVHDVATIKLNGIEVGNMVIPPYEIEITDAIRELHEQNIFEFELEVMIIGSLRNTLVGYGRKRPLMPVGLMGPVQIYFKKQIQWSNI